MEVPDLLLKLRRTAFLRSVSSSLLVSWRASRFLSRKSFQVMRLT